MILYAFFLICSKEGETLKAVKAILAGLLVVTVLFLAVYALFPEETVEPVISYITPSSSEEEKEEVESQLVSVDQTEESASSKQQGHPSTPTSSSNSSSSESVTPININTATQEELQQLDGITAELARLIVLYREKAGGYESIEDLKKITQLGYNTFEKIKDKIICK